MRSFPWSHVYEFKHSLTIKHWCEICYNSYIRGLCLEIKKTQIQLVYDQQSELFSNRILAGPQQIFRSVPPVFMFADTSAFDMKTRFNTHNPSKLSQSAACKLSASAHLGPLWQDMKSWTPRPRARTVPGGACVTLRVSEQDVGLWNWPTSCGSTACIWKRSPAHKSERSSEIHYHGLAKELLSQKRGSIVKKTRKSEKLSSSSI